MVAEMVAKASTRGGQDNVSLDPVNPIVLFELESPRFEFAGHINAVCLGCRRAVGDALNSRLARSMGRVLQAERE